MQTKKEIEEKVFAILADKLGVNTGDITLQSNFISDLGADSLDTVELVMEFERTFGIKIPDDDTSLITNVGDTIEYLYNKLS